MMWGLKIVQHKRNYFFTFYQMQRLCKSFIKKNVIILPHLKTFKQKKNPFTVKIISNHKWTHYLQKYVVYDICKYILKACILIKFCVYINSRKKINVRIFNCFQFQFRFFSIGLSHHFVQGFIKSA